MKIEKLPSGSYRIRKMYKGKMHTVTFDYKPTQKEALLAMAEKLDQADVHIEHITFHQAAVQYVDMKRNVLSPRTVKEYLDTPRRLSKHFNSLLLSDITQIDIQKEINALSKDKNPKTVRNYHGFISAVLGVFRPDMKIYTTLPQKRKSAPYVPSDEDVKKILEHTKGSIYEVPIILACYGMRRSEICALEPEDLEGNIVHINKAKVLGDNKEWIIKPIPKTTASIRDIVIPIYVADKIQEQGYIYRGHPNSIGKYLNKVQKQLGIPCFSIHKLRHYFASKMSAMHIPEADILKMGGWQTDHVMKSVYRHAMADKDMQSQKMASDKLQEVLFN